MFSQYSGRMKILCLLASFHGLFTVVSSCCSNVSPSFSSQFSSSLQGVYQLAGEVSSTRVSCDCVLATSHTDICRINKAVPIFAYILGTGIGFWGHKLHFLMAPALIFCFELTWHRYISEAVILGLEHSCDAMLDTGSPEMPLLGQQIQHSTAAHPCLQDWDGEP